MPVKNTGNIGKLTGLPVAGLPVLPIGHRQGVPVFAPGGRAAFSPADIEASATGVLWLKADAGVFQDSSFTTPAGADDVVGGWVDQFATANSPIQATTANKPILRTAHVNGLPSIQWDGATDLLEKTSFPDFDDDFTIFVVGRSETASGSGQCYLEVSNGSLNTGFHLNAETLTNFTARDSVGLKSVTGTDNRDSAYHLHTMHNTDAELQYWLDNASEGTTAYTPPNPNTLNQLNLGRLAISSNFLDGFMAEIIIYKSLLSAADRASVNSYLADRYGLTLS